MGSICSNFPGLVHPLAVDWVRCGILLVDSIVVLAATVLSLEFLDTVRISFQLPRYLSLMELPRISLTESWMVLLRVQIDNIAKDGHQWKEEPKDIM
jgi:hypothetical protein